MKILANDGLDQQAVEILTAHGHEVDTNHYDGIDLVEKLLNAEVLIVRSGTKVDATLIEKVKAGSLRKIIRAGVGLDNIDIKWANACGIEVNNTPNSSSNAVAELVLGHMFALARYIPVADHTMKAGQWNKKLYKGTEIFGKTLGIIGFGRAGQALARKADALGMNIIFYDAFLQAHDTYRFLPLEELLAQADYISLHTSATARPILGRDEFMQMKPGVFIINASRGSVIDEEALIEALDQGIVAGAGLDVYCNEPHPYPGLCCHERVIATPHLGGSTKEAQGRIGQEVVNIVLEMEEVDGYPDFHGAQAI